MQTPYQFRTYFMMSSSQSLIPRFSLFSIVLFTACSLFSSLARASIVSLTGLYATAYEGNGGGEAIYSPALGTTVLDTAGTIYDSTASTSRQLLSLTASSTGGLFQSNVEQYRAADLYNQAAGSEIRSLNFEVNQNTTASLALFSNTPRYRELLMMKLSLSALPAVTTIIPSMAVQLVYCKRADRTNCIFIHHSGINTLFPPKHRLLDVLRWSWATRLVKALVVRHLSRLFLRR
jgi:hypothetical protein